MDAPSRARHPRTAAERLAWSQGGLITSSQARDCGVTKDVVLRLVKTGAWRRLLPRVLAVGPEDDWCQRVRGACMWAGPDAAASHRSAARLFGMVDASHPEVEITTPRRLRSPAPWVVVHECRVGIPLQRLDGIAVTPMTRTLIDLSAELEAEPLELLLEEALRRRLTSLPRLELALASEAGCRRAPALTRLVLARRGQRPTESELEARVLRLLERAGLPRPECQFEVTGPSGFKARLDFAYPGAKVAIEADGFRWHSGRTDFDSDRRRLSTLASLGWRVLHVTWDDVRRPDAAFLPALSRLVGPRSLF